MKKQLIAYLFLSSFAFWQYAAAAPIPYSGKVAINGLNFQGDAQFTFALRDADGTVHWRNGVDANASINVPVDRGLYIVLLGGQGMNALSSTLFLDHPELYLQVRFYSPDTQEWLHLAPDQRITSAPHALAAEVANLANLAKAVEPGAITKSMLAADVLADLNATVVVSEQNNTGQIVSITRDMLPWDVLQDLNGTISRSRLSADVLDDLNQSIKAITREMLPWDVLQDLNGTISRSRLAQDVLADLNHTIGTDSITLDKLSPQVRADLNGTISRSRLPSDVLADLNKTITRGDLPADVLADLNRTVTATDIAANTITTSQLNESILKYLRPEITTSPQAPGLVFGGQSVTFAGAGGGQVPHLPVEPQRATRRGSYRGNLGHSGRQRHAPRRQLHARGEQRFRVGHFVAHRPPSGRHPHQPFRGPERHRCDADDLGARTGRLRHGKPFERKRGMRSETRPSIQRHLDQRVLPRESTSLRRPSTKP